MRGDGPRGGATDPDRCQVDLAVRALRPRRPRSASPRARKRWVVSVESFLASGDVGLSFAPSHEAFEAEREIRAGRPATSRPSLLRQLLPAPSVRSEPRFRVTRAEPRDPCNARRGSPAHASPMKHTTIRGGAVRQVASSRRSCDKPQASSTRARFPHVPVMMKSTTEPAVPRACSTTRAAGVGRTLDRGAGAPLSRGRRAPGRCGRGGHERMAPGH
jgi:hypothetical protein